MRINDPDSFVSLSILLKTNLFLQVGVRWWANGLFPLLLCTTTGKQSKRRQRTIQSLCEGKKNNALTVNKIAVAKGARHEAGKCSRGEVRPGG